MKHARPDYDLIQDPRGKIPKDEPVFLLRGQDPKAQACMRLWCELAAKDGSDPRLTTLVQNHIALVDEWQRKIRVKPSDLPNDPNPSTGTAAEIAKDQVWECTDHRERGVQMQVIFVQGIDVLCNVIAGQGGRPVRGVRQQRVPIRQLMPGPACRYKLIKP